MTPAAASFEATLTANAAHHGGMQQVTIAGATPKDAIVEEITADEVVVLGGTGERGGFRAHCRVSDFSSPPLKNHVITYDGNALYILNVVKTNQAIYTLIAGDPVTNE